MTQDQIRQVLDVARWAPSGDNTQPWRFEISGDTTVVVHGFDTRSHCVYDLDGRASQISLGALLETMSIAASAHRWEMDFLRRAGQPDDRQTFDVAFSLSSDRVRDPLLDFVKTRTVQRRPMQARPLTEAEKSKLEACLAPRFSVRWLEGLQTKWQVANLMFSNAKVRLTMPEAFEVHRAVIEWGAQYSEDRMPDAALGADSLTTRLMRYVMKDWARVEFFNRYLAGTVAPRLQLDLIPGLACAAHFVLVDELTRGTIDDHVEAGRAVQRFWLTATQLGLHQQPEMTPLIFGSYVRAGMPFTRVPKVAALAGRVAARLKDVIGVDPGRAVWMGRLGAGPAATARSVRLPLSSLMKDV